jgi:rsbT co-antagonist protein RsbR
MKPEYVAITEVLANPNAVVGEWLAEVSGATGSVRATKTTDAIVDESGKIACAVFDGLRAEGDVGAFEGAAWEPLRGVPELLSRSRAAQGATAGERSCLLLSFKRALFARLQQHLANEPPMRVASLWSVCSLVDKMAQFTLEVHQRSHEDIIKRQQDELLELSTPVIKLWEDVLAVPMIGALDGGRSQRFCRNGAKRPRLAARPMPIRKPARRTGSRQTRLGL